MLSTLIFTISVLAVNAPMLESAIAQPLNQITACVEPTVQVANNVSRKRASTQSDCNPAVAEARSREQAGVNARNAIAPLCVDRVTQAEAAATCQSWGLTVPTTAGTSLGRAPIAADGRPPADASLPINTAPNGPKLCAVLRNVPNETETSSQDDLLCFFNGFRKTTVTSRVRATCGVQCF